MKSKIFLGFIFLIVMGLTSCNNANVGPNNQINYFKSANYTMKIGNW